VGQDLQYGFNGAIGRCIVNECGQEIIKEAIDEAKKLFKSASLKVGDFVSTTACKSKNHKFVLH